MPPKRQVYLLDSQKLSAETIAVTFARTSRSAQTFREIAEELTDEKSAKFHEKWVVGYGHASVAEHAILHVALEGISRLAAEALESSRLASFTEKSTRYQVWGKDDYCIPPEVKGSAGEPLFRKTVEGLFACYLRIIPKVTAWYQAHTVKLAGESETALEQRIRMQAIDSCRFLLPASSTANVGMTINARELEHLLCKLFSSPLGEVQEIAGEIKTAAAAVTPTLIKYAHANDYLKNSCHSFSGVSSEVAVKPEARDRCVLVDWDQEGERNVLAAGFFRSGNLGYGQVSELLDRMGECELEDLSARLLGGMGEHDLPIRELEYASLTFALQLDQGAFYELKRHRMATLTTQRLSTTAGYEIPRAIAEAGCLKEYSRAMEKAGSAYGMLAADFPDAASYVVPNGYLRNILIKFNLREAFHLVNLRTAPNAHFSLRMIVQDMAGEIIKIYPHLGRYLHPNPAETAQMIREKYFINR